MEQTRWRIELFGGLQVRFGDRVLGHFEMRRAASVLALLSYWPGRAHAREELIEMLWQDEEPEATRQRFRQVLTKLRRGLESLDSSGAELLIADRNYVRLDAALFRTDVAEFEQAVKASAMAPGVQERVHQLGLAVAQYRGELLPGHYDGWISSERERLAEAHVEALCRLAAALNECGQTDAAVDHARRAIAQDPLREESHCELIRIYAEKGRASEATRQYRELERILWKELRALPSPAAQALLQSAATPFRSLAMIALPGSAQADAATPSAPEQATPKPLTVSETSLPSSLSRFFGREEEIGALLALLKPPSVDQVDRVDGVDTSHAITSSSPTGPRLITLTGPGGSGKTRLALEVARRLQGGYATVAFVALENLKDPDEIPRALADALLPGRAQSASPLEQVAGALANRTALLVLDNFEHVINGGALVVRQLLQRTQSLRCLITSRQRLNIEGEHERSLLPLAVPEEGADIERLRTVPSVELFLDRARQARAEFTLGPHNARSIGGLCRRLEGLPLAIELTAAWAFTLSPEQMLDRLTKRFNLLVSRRQDSHSRHRSLRATIEWSYQQLPPDLQACFRKMSAFRGGWTMEAAEAVCDGSPETLENLDLLRERSLIQTHESGAEVRFGMLETLREFAEEQISQEERAALTSARQDYYLALAERAEHDLLGEDQLNWLAILRLEHENLRAVVNECAIHGDIEIGLRLVSALFRYWEMTPHIHEASHWLDVLLHSVGAVPTGVGGKVAGAVHGVDGADRLDTVHRGDGLNRPVSAAVRAKALEAAGNLACTARRDAQAKELLEESLALYGALGDIWGAARVECALGVVSRELLDFARARELLNRCLPTLQAQPDIYNLARAHGGLGVTEVLDGNSEAGKSYLETSAAFYLVCGNKRGLAWCHAQQGRLIADEGDLDVALTFMEESHALFRLIGGTRWLTWTTYYIGTVYRRQGHFDRAHAAFEEARRIAMTIGQSDFLSMLDRELQETVVETEAQYSI